jgi:hypothetical protein
LKLLSNSAKPNYYKVLINLEQKVALSNRDNILLDGLPFNKLIYREPFFKQIYGNHWGHCINAERALSNYCILKNNIE